jgi:hypothetical protein
MIGLPVSLDISTASAQELAQVFLIILGALFFEAGSSQNPIDAPKAVKTAATTSARKRRTGRGESSASAGV